MPVLTLTGQSFASRVCASLLGAVGLPDLITPSVDAFEAKAIALGRDGAARRDLKARLASNLTTSSLFDARAFARGIEAAYAVMVTRAQAGMALDHIEI